MNYSHSFCFIYLTVALRSRLFFIMLLYFSLSSRMLYSFCSSVTSIVPPVPTLIVGSYGYKDYYLFAPVLKYSTRVDWGFCLTSICYLVYLLTSPILLK